jgi:nucleotide-binding universal stress UspA family protein
MFRVIVWATDGSEHADRALECAKQLAHQDGSRLTVVHIVEKIGGGRAMGQPWHGDEDEIKAKVKAQAEALSEEGLDASLTIAGDFSGQPAHDIANIAREVGADLIVVGTRGRSTIGGLLLGGVTQRLLHIAPCPILAVPPVTTPQAPTLAAAVGTAKVAS